MVLRAAALLVWEEGEREVLLAGRVQPACTFFARLRGLQLRSHLEPGEGLLLEPCSSIHSFFMRFRFDAVFLSAENVVLRVDCGVRPWRAYLGHRRARRVLELPAGRVLGAGLQTGDRVKLIESGLE